MADEYGRFCYDRSTIPSDEPLYICPPPLLLSYSKEASHHLTPQFSWRRDPAENSFPRGSHRTSYQFSRITRRSAKDPIG